MPKSRFDIADIERGLQDAAVGERSWPDVLAELSRSVDAAGCILFSTDRRFKQNPCSPDLDALTERYFREGWYEQDPRYRGIPRMEATGVMTDLDCVSPEEIESSGFYRDFLEGNRRQSFAGVGFRAGDDLWCLSIQRSIEQGALQQDELQRLTALWRPFSDAATLVRTAGGAALEGMTFGLEAVGHAAFVCDHQGRVMKMNALAENLLDKHLGPGGELKLPNEAQRAFDLLLKQALDPVPKAVALSLSCVLPLPQRRLVCRAVRLLGNARLFFSQAHLLVMLKPEVPSLETMLRSLFRLSAAETKVVMALTEGLRIDEIAARFSVRADTIRTQLKSAFAKTGTSTQTQLVILCHRLTHEGV